MSRADVAAAFLNRSVTRLMDFVTSEIRCASAIFRFIETKKWTRDAAEAVIIEGNKRGTAVFGHTSVLIKFRDFTTCRDLGMWTEIDGLRALNLEALTTYTTFCFEELLEVTVHLKRKPATLRYALSAVQ